LGPTDAEEGEQGMSYGRCVIYSFAGDAQEVIEKARAGILPIFKRQSGFLAYGVMVEGDQIISMSAWDSESDAKAADEAAKQWVSENMDAKVVHSFIGNYAWLEFAQQ
jgi:heme-degrading monooxygenase HmoA